MQPIRLDPGAATPPYEQLRTQLAAMIADGRLPAGAKLPTIRRLALDLGLAANTVAKSYRLLESDGLVATDGRRGTFVASTSLDPGGPAGGAVSDAAAAYARAARRAGLSSAEALRLVERAWNE